MSPWILATAQPGANGSLISWIIVVALLIIVIVYSRSRNKRAVDANAAIAPKSELQQSTAAPSGAVTPAQSLLEASLDDEEIAAVIAAALAICLQQQPTATFTVTKIRRTNIWSMAGRNDQMRTTPHSI